MSLTMYSIRWSKFFFKRRIKMNFSMLLAFLFYCYNQHKAINQCPVLLRPRRKCLLGIANKSKKKKKLTTQYNPRSVDISLRLGRR